MIIGEADVTELMLVALLVEGHVLLEDVPGTGKTTLAKALAAEPPLLLRPDPVHAGPVAQQGWNRVAEPDVEYKVSPGQKE